MDGNEETRQAQEGSHDDDNHNDGAAGVEAGRNPGRGIRTRTNVSHQHRRRLSRTYLDCSPFLMVSSMLRYSAFTKPYSRAIVSTFNGPQGRCFVANLNLRRNAILGWTGLNVPIHTDEPALESRSILAPKPGNMGRIETGNSYPQVLK